MVGGIKKYRRGDKNMATKKIRMIPPGYTDTVHPETDASIVLYGATNVAAKLNDIVGTKTAAISTTWTGAAAPYTQTISIAGIVATDRPIISPVYSASNATAIAQKEAWNMISKIETGASALYVTCFEEKPTIAIPIQIKGV